MVASVVEFVWDTLGQDIASDAYQGVKKILGNYFAPLAQKKEENQKESFEENLSFFLNDPEKLKELTALMSGKTIIDSLNENEDSNLDIELGNGEMQNSGNNNKGSDIKVS
jgi:hypothetical protein